MYKSDKIISIAVLSAVGAAFLALVVLVVSMCFVDGEAVYDPRTGDVTWKGVRYVHIPGADVSGTTKELSRWSFDEAILEIVEDPDHTFLMVWQGRDTYVVVREDYVVPTEGEITAFLWGEKYITDEAACAALDEVLRSMTATFTYETMNLYRQSATQNLKELTVAYDGCPVATQQMGLMGTADGRLAVTYEMHSNGETEPLTVSCYEIPEEQAAILLPYLI